VFVLARRVRRVLVRVFVLGARACPRFVHVLVPLLVRAKE
jgi:hypothetical protein